MKEEKDEQAFLASARKILDDAGENLEASICSRLTRARMAAVDQGRSRAPRPWRWSAVPITAGVAIVLVFVSLWFRGGPEGIGPAAEVVDMEILTAPEAPDFYADLEFYQWLAEDDDHADG
jgi:hypothetical protein